MSMNERSEILSALYRERAEVGVIYQRCQDSRALAVGMKVQIARDALNEAIAEFQPDSPAPCEMQFPTPKN
jgi:hypothetical protein